MIRNKMMYCMIAAATALAASCTDFDDYNEAYTAGSEESKLTLWENISGNGDLSQFAELLQKGDYDEVLNSPRFFTVWAPKNGTFDYSTLAAMDKESLVDRFIKNHIANYNYNISTTEERRVYTLNEKSMVLDYSTYAGLDIDANGKNLPNSNGILHLINGYAEYHPNLYEYIYESGSDSLATYFEHFEYPYFDESKSIVGPIDSLGRQTYSDSVIVDMNYLTDAGSGLIGAELANEDSLYTLLIPTNEAYKGIYERVRSYYRYPESNEIKYLPLTSDAVGKEQTVQIRSEYTADSIARMRIARTLAYSHNNYYNQWIDEIDESLRDEWQTDTLMPTYYSDVKLSNGKEILGRTIGAPLQQSNGYARMVDSLAILPWEAWCPEINVNIFSSDVRPLYSGCQPPTNYTVIDGSYGPDVTRYLAINGINDSSKPEMYFNLSGVRSAEYNIYIVLLPVVCNQESEENKLTQFDVDLSYMGENGSMTELKFTKLLTDSANINKVDTFHVGSVTFPYAYTGTDANPYLHIKINRNKYNKTEKEYDYNFRIAAIILRPVEYDEYLKNEQ